MTIYRQTSFLFGLIKTEKELPPGKADVIESLLEGADIVEAVSLDHLRTTGGRNLIANRDVLERNFYPMDCYHLRREEINEAGLRSVTPIEIITGYERRYFWRPSSKER